MHADKTSQVTVPVPGNAAKSVDDRLRTQVEWLESLGFSRERMLTQLRAHFPAELLRARFPEQPASLFDVTLPAKRRLRSASPGDPRAGIAPSTATRSSPPVLNADTSVANTSPAPVRASVVRIIEQAEQAVQESGGLSFQYVPLIQCSFPHADPGGQACFTRRNGWLELTLGTTRPEIGLPYGVPARLLTLYITSEAVRGQSREIFLGHTVHDFLRRLDVPITRGPRGSLTVYANQVLRLVHATLTIDENIQDSRGRSGLHIRQAVFAEEARLWWDETRGVGEGSSLLLSPTLYQSMIERSAPLSTSAIRKLRKSPMDLDVYAWLTHRMFHLAKPSNVSWAQLSGQFGHGYRELRKFRRFFLDSLKRVQVVYPEAKFRIGEGGLLLLPSRSHVPRTGAVSRR
jgi:hypothetical protein